MTSTNKINTDSFKPLSKDVIRKMEKLSTSPIPMSMCLPSSIYFWDTNDNCSYLKINPNLYLLRRSEWLDDKNIVYSSTIIHTRKDLTELINTAKKLKIKELRDITFLYSESPSLPKKVIVFHNEDRAEYIYETLLLSKLEGSSYSEIRSKIRKFEAQYNDNIFLVDSAPPDNKKIDKILNLYESWVELSGLTINTSANKERDALYKLLESYKIRPKLRFTDKQLFYYLYVKDRLVGFSVVEEVSPSGAVGHFLKLNHNITGISEYFINKIAKDLYSRGIELLNAEEDMGSKGLREFKKRLRPYKLLYSYDILLG